MRNKSRSPPRTQRAVPPKPKKGGAWSSARGRRGDWGPFQLLLMRLLVLTGEEEADEEAASATAVAARSSSGKHRERERSAAKKQKQKNESNGGSIALGHFRSEKNIRESRRSRLQRGFIRHSFSGIPTRSLCCQRQPLNLVVSVKRKVPQRKQRARNKKRAKQ